MKISKLKLKQIIKEEIEAVEMEEGIGDFFGKMFGKKKDEPVNMSRSLQDSKDEEDLEMIEEGVDFKMEAKYFQMMDEAQKYAKYILEKDPPEDLARFVKDRGVVGPKGEPAPIEKEYMQDIVNHLLSDLGDREFENYGGAGEIAGMAFDDFRKRFQDVIDFMNKKAYAASDYLYTRWLMRSKELGLGNSHKHTGSFKDRLFDTLDRMTLIDYRLKTVDGMGRSIDKPRRTPGDGKRAVKGY